MVVSPPGGGSATVLGTTLLGVSGAEVLGVTASVRYLVSRMTVDAGWCTVLFL